MHVASAKDKNPTTCDVAFYGVIDEIWVIDYRLLKVRMLKCDCQNSGSVKKGEHGFVLVDLNWLRYKSDLSILASQAKQVFCVPN